MEQQMVLGNSFVGCYTELVVEELVDEHFPRSFLSRDLYLEVVVAGLKALYTTSRKSIQTCSRTSTVRIWWRELSVV